MKNKKSWRGLMLPVAAGLLTFGGFFSSCEKETDQFQQGSTGSLAVRLTDLPGNYLQVNVDIKEVYAHLADTLSPAGWYLLSTHDTIYNLLDLQNDISAALANGSILPAGKITQLRLVLGNNNTVMLSDSTIHALDGPASLQKAGLKINLNTTIEPGDTTVVTLDFDAGESVVATDNGRYLLKPVIKVKSIAVK
ncbi:MAG: DUF4382 domain-containing protein [Bacteroidia bacterium]|nr:DUF4382 domain-containing protein [Bacteroidia bacterium]